MYDELPDEKAERMANRVDLTPIFQNYDDVRGDLNPPLADLADELVVHGEVQVVAEEHPEGVEFHAGNTEFDTDAEVIRVDEHGDFTTIRFDSVITHTVHYDL